MGVRGETSVSPCFVVPFLLLWRALVTAAVGGIATVAPVVWTGGGHGSPPSARMSKNAVSPVIHWVRSASPPHHYGLWNFDCGRCSRLVRFAGRARLPGVVSGGRKKRAARM